MNSIPPLHDNNAPLPGSSPTVEYNDLRFAASSIPTGFTRFSEDSSASGKSNTKKNKAKSSKSPRSPRKKPTKASSSRSIKSNGSTSNTTNDDERPKRPLSAYSKCYLSIDSIDVVFFYLISIYSTHICANNYYAFPEQIICSQILTLLHILVCMNIHRHFLPARARDDYARPRS